MASSTTIALKGPSSIRGMANLKVRYFMSFRFVLLLHKLTSRLGPAFEKDVKGRLYPVIGMTEPAAVAVNFGSDVESRPFKWELGNSGKYDIDAVKMKKEEEPVTVQVPIEFGISKPPI